MFTKNAILAVLFVMVTGVMAADKPAVEARLKMEGQGSSAVIVSTESASAVQFAQAPFGGNDGTTKPAVAARSARAEAQEVVVAEKPAKAEHPIADVGYHASANAGYTVQEAPAADMGTKPAVRARNR